MRNIHAVLFALAVSAAGCSSSVSTSTSPPAGPDSSTLTGTWAGDLSLTGTTAKMSWTLTQAGSNVTGRALVLLPNGTVLLNGAFSGTFSGAVLSYTIDISAGGIPSQPACTG